MASPVLLNQPLFLLVLLIGMIFFHFFLKKVFLFKYQWMLNFRFPDYLARKSSPDQEISIKYDSMVKLPVDKIKRQFQALKIELTSHGLALISNPVILLMVMNRMSDKNHSNQKMDFTDIIRKYVWRHILLNVLVFFMLLIPFILISLLLTIGIQFHFKYLIFFLGFIFAYFLHSALFAPIISLLIQKFDYESVVDR
jgi:hypothetical protein